MKTLSFDVTGCIKCCDCGPQEITVGRRVQLDLDNSAITGLPDKIFAEVVSVTETTFGGVKGRTYGFEYDEADLLPSTLLELRKCDVLGVPTCVGPCVLEDFTFDPITRELAIEQVCGDILKVVIPAGAVDTNTFVTGVVFDPGTRVLSVTRNDGAVFTATVPDTQVTSLVFDPVSRTFTLNQNGLPPLSVNVPDANTFVTGATFDNGSRDLTITRNDGLPNIVVNIPDADIFIDSISYDPNPGGTPILTIIETNGAVNTVSIPDNVVTGSTFDPVTRNLTLTRNNGLPSLVSNIPHTVYSLTENSTPVVDAQSEDVGAVSFSVNGPLGSVGSVVIPRSAYTVYGDRDCGFVMSQIFNDGTPSIITPIGSELGFVNKHFQASVTGNAIGLYTVHELRGEADGGALNTATLNVAQKVFFTEAKPDDCTRVSTAIVEDWVGNTAFVDARFGNDATALHERSDKPFRNVQTAVNAATAGSEIEIHSGLYNETVTINKDLNINAAGVTLYRVEMTSGIFRLEGHPDFINSMFLNGVRTTAYLGNLGGVVSVQAQTEPYHIEINTLTTVENPWCFLINNQNNGGVFKLNKGVSLQSDPNAALPFFSFYHSQWGRGNYFNFNEIETIAIGALTYNNYNYASLADYPNFNKGAFAKGSKIVSSNARAAIILDYGAEVTIEVSDVYNSVAHCLNMINETHCRLSNSTLHSPNASTIFIEGLASTSQNLYMNDVVLKSAGTYSIEVTGGSLARRVWSYGVSATLPYDPLIVQMAGTAPYVNAAVA